MTVLSTLSAKQAAACKKLRNCKSLSWRYHVVIQEFLDCCWLSFERDLYVVKSNGRDAAINLLSSHYNIRSSDCLQILNLKDCDSILVNQPKSKKETMKLNNHVLNKHLSVLGVDQLKVAKNLKGSYECYHESNLEEFEFYCKSLFLKDLEKIKALYKTAHGTTIPAWLAAVILTDYYDINLKDTCYILAREERCSRGLYQRILKKLREEEIGIQTLIFTSRTECQKMLNLAKRQEARCNN